MRRIKSILTQAIGTRGSEHAETTNSIDPPTSKCVCFWQLTLGSRRVAEVLSAGKH